MIERDERPPVPGPGHDHHMYVGEHPDFCDFPPGEEENRKIRERERASLILHLSLKTRRDERLQPPKLGNVLSRFLQNLMNDLDENLSTQNSWSYFLSECQPCEE